MFIYQCFICLYNKNEYNTDKERQQVLGCREKTNQVEKVGGGTEERLLQQGVELVDEEEERDKGLFEIPAILNHTVLFSRSRVGSF